MHAEVFAQNSGMLHARVPSVSDTQHPLAHPAPEVQTAVQTVPTRDPRSSPVR